MKFISNYGLGKALLVIIRLSNLLPSQKVNCQRNGLVSFCVTRDSSLTHVELVNRTMFSITTPLGNERREKNTQLSRPLSPLSSFDDKITSLLIRCETEESWIKTTADTHVEHYFNQRNHISINERLRGRLVRTQRPTHYTHRLLIVVSFFLVSLLC